jgi:cell division protein FtsQ
VYSLGDSLVGKSINEVDVQKIHDAVMEIPAVKSADVFKTVDGKVSVSVEQCRPLARFINADGSGFYLDVEGGIIPLSSHFSARVPVFTGNVYEEKGRSIHELVHQPELAEQSIIDEAFQLINFINEDEFWKAQTEHIYVNADAEFEIVPRVGSHRILIGKGEQLELRLKKMMAFYEKVMPRSGINQYKLIDLRFKDQVVCRK